MDDSWLPRQWGRGLDSDRFRSNEMNGTQCVQNQIMISEERLVGDPWRGRAPSRRPVALVSVGV
jgi:hypothetical protein